jgi:uncharacterized protein
MLSKEWNDMQSGMTGEKLAPVSETERIREIDMLRGFALFGVLLVNTQMFNDTLMSFPSSPFNYTDSVNQWTALAIQIFATGKFYTIFSFLFGLGFFMFMQRLEAKGLKPEPVFRRRLFFLLLFGLLHMFFFWYGDILTSYAITGFILMAFYRQNPVQIKRWIIVLLTISTLMFSAILTMQYAASGTAGSNHAFAEETVRLYQQGTLLETIRFRLQVEAMIVFANLVFWIPKILSLFLAGVYAGKIGLFINLKQKKPFIRTAWIRSGLIGWTLTAYYVAHGLGFDPFNPIAARFMAEASKEISTVALCLFYITSLLLLWQHSAWRKLLSAFEGVGRLALTHYLTQSLILSLIFYGHGLGLMHRIPLWQGVIISIVIYTIQVIISQIYMKHFHQGPMEALWRKGTYGKKPETA